MKRVLGLLAIAACTPQDRWLDFGDVAFDSTGQTPELTVPWENGGRALHLEVESPTHRCFQLDGLADDGHSYIDHAESGPSCVECEHRVSVGMGGASFQLPSRAGTFAPRGSLRMRLGLRDCDTLARAAETGVLHVRARVAARSPERGKIALRLIVTPAFAGRATDERLASVLEALNTELSSAQLTASLARVVRLPADFASDATFSRGDPSQLQTLLNASPVSDGIPVVLAGCLQQSDPVLSKTTEVQGYTPHIPGGSGPADALFLQGSLCGTPGPVPINWAATSLARVLAHELGHYLGLYHSVEADGSTDQLDDTDGSNVMFFRPSQATSTGFSATQGELMRAHPAVFGAD